MSYFPNEKLETFLNHVIAKEHAFIRNIYDHDEIKMSKPISTIENYRVEFKKLLHVSSLLNSSYSSESDTENIMVNCVVEFLEETNFNNFAEVFLEISNTKIKNIRWDNRKNQKILQIISFVYYQIMDFPPNKFEIKTVITKTFSRPCQKHFIC